MTTLICAILAVIPSDDRVFAESIAEALLETKGEAGLANVINLWDEVGAYGSIGLEIDRWIRTRDRWFIGVSCKRTLRERWKQAYTTDIDLLNRHKIKALWHVLTFDRDLSDNKLTEMGSYRAVVYLRDDSPRYRSASQHPGMQDYVRPMSRFIDDLKQEIS